jgi:hypothetical protein
MFEVIGLERAGSSLIFFLTRSSTIVVCIAMLAVDMSSTSQRWFAKVLKVNSARRTLRHRRAFRGIGTRSYAANDLRHV